VITKIFLVSTITIVVRTHQPHHRPTGTTVRLCRVQLVRVALASRGALLGRWGNGQNRKLAIAPCYAAGGWAPRRSVRASRHVVFDVYSQIKTYEHSITIECESEAITLPDSPSWRLRAVPQRTCVRFQRHRVETQNQLSSMCIV
jgi:hypothetical protein